MSVAILDLVWKQSKAKQGNLLVLLAIADYADDQGRAYPGVTAIGRKARLSTRQVQRALRELQVLGEVDIRNNAGLHGTNLYQVTLCQGRQNVRGHIRGYRGMTPMSPKPSEETVRRKNKNSGDILSPGIKMNGSIPHRKTRQPIPV